MHTAVIIKREIVVIVKVVLRHDKERTKPSNKRCANQSTQSKAMLLSKLDQHAATLYHC